MSTLNTPRLVSKHPTRLRTAMLSTLAAGALALGGCSNGLEGGLSGAALGALGGLAIGSISGDMGKGAAIGAVVGGLGGAVLGDQNERRDRRYDPPSDRRYNESGDGRRW